MKEASFKAMILLLLALATSAVAQTFYFLPPYDPEWMRKTPHILDLDTRQATPMSIDTAAGSCGWYKISIESSLQDHNIVVWPGKTNFSTLNSDETTDRIGVNGLDDGPDTWSQQPPRMPEAIKFSERFSQLGNTVYFDPSNGKNGWGTNPGTADTKRCFYSMAAIIYDTDPSKMNAFKCAETGGCDFDNDPAAGIVRNIPKAKLGRDANGVPKMEWRGRGSGLNGWNQGDFEAAFKCSPGKNSMICYDMPFQRDHRGLWTFDSDYLCDNGELDLQPKRIEVYSDATNLCRSSKPVLGFFPNRLNKANPSPGMGQNEDPPLDASCTYSQCPECANRYMADPLAPLHIAASARVENCGNEYYTPPYPRFPVNPRCYEQARQSGSATVSGSGGGKQCSFGSHTSTDNSDCGAAYPEGAFRDGDNPPIWNFDLRGWRDWDGGYKAPNPNFRDLFAGGGNDSYYGSSKQDTENNKDVIKRNQYFCFESHATFVYEAGQKFYFSGDDDIWVYINDRIVIDNGGNHLATPGYVDLDSIGGGRWANAQAVSGVDDGSGAYPRLEEGGEYALDIFFCDRRQTSSNIRVSTNMYIVQTNGILVKGDAKQDLGGAHICVQQDGAGSCAALLGGSGGQGSKISCDAEVGRFIEFYLDNRKRDDKRPLDARNENCQADGDQKFVCYGGIYVDLNNATVKVDQGKITGLVGTQYVYAKVKEGTMKPPLPEDEKVATISTQTFVRMAWGNIVEEATSSPTITNICKQDPIAATGELVPVCFSSGEPFGEYFLTGPINDPQFGIGGSTLRLNTAGFLNQSSMRLKVYFDSLGASPLTKLDTTLTLPRTDAEAKPNSGSRAGVLVLWVTGDYLQEINPDYYTINVTGRANTEEVKLKSVIPKLQWIRASGGDILNITGSDRQNKGSKWSISGDPTSALVRENGYPAPVWVGEEIRLWLRAYNDETKKVCTTCNYELFSTAEANGITEKNSALINAQSMRIVNGEAGLGISGKRDVQHPSYARIVVRGVSPLADAAWDSLSFQEPPVPYPEKTRIFDENGDGFGDRIVITYNRGFRADSLPSAIEVQWDKDTTVVYGIGTISLNSENKEVYSASNISKSGNRDYWRTYLVGNPNLEARAGWDKVQMMGVKDVIELKLGPKGEDDVRFSKKVLTKSETGKIANWASFETGEGALKKAADFSLTSNIEDSIPAIIISARYLADDVNKGCGGSPNSSCRDKVTLEFSEPVKIDPGASGLSPDAPELRNTFAYMLRDLGKSDWDVLGTAFLSPSMRYNKSGIERPGEDGNDSIVSMFFNRYREGDNKSGTPMPGDSVKFASLGKYAGFARNILVDVKGNPPNPREIGRQIEGRKPFTPDKLPIGEIDPNYPDYVLNITETLDRNGSSGYDKDNLFNKDKPIELLPVPPDCDINCVKREYPGTIGVIFNPDVFNELADLEDLYGPISDGNITIYPKVFYHTNLGNYVVDRGFSVKCDDPIFPRNSYGQPSCRDSRSKFYVAWDMKDFKGRFVGAGAYVGLYDFYWEVYIPSVNQTQKKESIERKVEMHGVKRVKKR